MTVRAGSGFHYKASQKRQQKIASLVGKLSVKEICCECQVTAPTVYKVIHALRRGEIVPAPRPINFAPGSKMSKPCWEHNHLECIGCVGCLCHGMKERSRILG